MNAKCPFARLSQGRVISIEKNRMPALWIRLECISPLAISANVLGLRTIMCLPQFSSYCPCNRRQKWTSSCECGGTRWPGGCVASVNFRPATSRSRRRLAREQLESTLPSVRGFDIRSKKRSSPLFRRQFRSIVSRPTSSFKSRQITTCSSRPMRA